MHPDWILLEEMFARHRQQAFVCCDEKCFCWDVEKWLFDVEEIRPTLRAVDPPSALVGDGNSENSAGN